MKVSNLVLKATHKKVSALSTLRDAFALYPKQQSTNSAGRIANVKQEMHQISEYPNPLHSDDELTITINQELNLDIFNMQGIRLQSFENMKGGIHNIALSLPSGIYLIKAYNKEGINLSNKKLIVY
jgi:hypothetical protein